MIIKIYNKQTMKTESYSFPYHREHEIGTPKDDFGSTWDKKFLELEFSKIFPMYKFSSKRFPISYVDRNGDRIFKLDPTMGTWCKNNLGNNVIIDPLDCEPVDYDFNSIKWVDMFLRGTEITYTGIMSGIVKMKNPDPYAYDWQTITKEVKDRYCTVKGSPYAAIKEKLIKIATNFGSEEELEDSGRIQNSINKFWDLHYEDYLLNLEEANLKVNKYDSILEIDIPKISVRHHMSCLVRCGDDEIRVCGEDIQDALDMARATLLPIYQGDWEICNCRKE